MDIIRESNPWTIVYLENCPYSAMALSVFESRGMMPIYTELDIPLNNRYVMVVNVPAEKKKHILNQLAPITNNYRTFPLIFRQKTFFGGYDTLVEEYLNPM